jgi:hypothetical protein
MTAPITSKKTPIRNTSYVSLSSIALTVATAWCFANAGVPLKSNTEYAVVAGFWFVISTGGLWLWKCVSRRGRKDSAG